MAAESAWEQARRRRENAARNLRAAERWERGAQGEEATAAALRALPQDEWTVFHDVTWPGRKLANIDHVVVGPGGVFVIDSKNWTGRIEVRDGVLRQNGYSREPAVASAAEAGIAVSLLAPYLEARLAVPVLCFAHEEPIAGWVRDVMICSTANVAGMLATRPVALDAAQRTQICLGLDLGLSRAGASPPTAAWESPPVPGPRSEQSRHPTRTPSVVAGGARARRRRSRPSAVAGLRRLAAVALVVYLLGSGTLSPVVDRISEFVADVATPDQVDPAPDRPQKPDRERPGRRQEPPPS